MDGLETNAIQKLTRVLAIILAIWSVAYIAHLPSYLGINVAPPQHQAIFLALALALTFLSYPAKKGKPPGNWYDWLLVILGIIPCGYVVIFYDLWQFHAGISIVTYEVIFGISLTLAVLEGLRRVLGMIITVLLILFILHPLFNDHLPGILSGRGYPLERVISAIYFPPEGIFSVPLNIAATIIIGFLVFGQFLIYSGAGEVLMDLALSLVGRRRGGAAKAAIAGSGLFGSLSGSVAANVAITGTFTIPMMKSSGYRSDFAGGVEASASNGGQLMPPVMGAVAFVMADMLEVPYFKICSVAFIPAISYYFCMFMQAHFEASRLGLEGLSASDLPSFRKTVKKAWLYLLPVVVLIYLLFGLKYSPELSSFWATVCLVLITAFKKETRLSLREVSDALEKSGRAVTQVALPCVMAGVAMASLSLTGVALYMAGEIVKLAGGHLFLLLLLAAMASFIFGLGMTSIPCYIFVTIMVAPALEQVGISRMAAHFFVFWLALGSFITPPVCIAAFVASAIAQASPMRVGVRATLIGIGIYIIPFAFIYNPGLLLMGSLFEIVSSTIFVLIGLVALSAAIEGYLLERINLFQRALLFASAVLMFAPHWKTRFFGTVILAAIFAWQYRNKLQNARFQPPKACNAL
ncbi:MAG: TRAP transporter fused permease subunit [Dehalococcoidales bacterium]|nr:TRAP transporter fused permease subunit [Dehalococcoidales bacterium]